MPDLPRIKSNVQKMVDQGASGEEIDRYLAGEGTSPEEIRSAPQGSQYETLAGNPQGVSIVRKPPPVTPVKNAIKGFVDLGNTALEGVSSLAGLAGNIIDLPSNAVQAIQSIKKSPVTAIPSALRTARDLGLGFTGYPETISTALSGKIPPAEMMDKESALAGLSLLAPKALGLAKRTARAVVRELPGSGVELHARAIPKINAIVEGIRPIEAAVQEAYGKVAELGNPTLAVDKLRAAAKDILRDEENAAAKGLNPNTAMISQAKQILESSTNGWAWADVQAAVRRLGEQIGNIVKNKGEKLSEVKRLFASLGEDIETGNSVFHQPSSEYIQPRTVLNELGQPVQIPGYAVKGEPIPTMNPGGSAAIGSAFKDAQTLARREYAANELQAKVNESMGVGGEGFDTVSPNKVVKWIAKQQLDARIGVKTAKRFVDSFGPGELDSLKAQFRQISKGLPAIPAGRGVVRGSSERVLQIGAGELIGEHLGLTRGTGAMAGPLVAETISRSLQTEGGRAFVGKAMDIKPFVSKRTRGASEAITRGILSNPNMTIEDKIRMGLGVPR